MYAVLLTQVDVLNFLPLVVLPLKVHIHIHIHISLKKQSTYTKLHLIFSIIQKVNFLYILYLAKDYRKDLQAISAYASSKIYDLIRGFAARNRAK